MEQERKSPQDLSWKTPGAGGIAWFRDDQEFFLRDTEVERKAGIQVTSLQSFKLGKVLKASLSQTCHPKGCQIPLFKAAEISSILLQSEVY